MLDQGINDRPKIAGFRDNERTAVPECRKQDLHTRKVIQGIGEQPPPEGVALPEGFEFR